jgi:hypothetical protein
MAAPTCPKCGSGSFTMTEFTPAHSEFRLNAVHCGACGAVIGVMDFYNIGGRLNKQDEAIKKIAKQIGASLGEGWT